MNRRVFICRECCAPSERPMCYRCGKRLFEEMKRRLGVLGEFKAALERASVEIAKAQEVGK